MEPLCHILPLKTQGRQSCYSGSIIFHLEYIQGNNSDSTYMTEVSITEQEKVIHEYSQ